MPQNTVETPPTPPLGPLSAPGTLLLLINLDRSTSRLERARTAFGAAGLTVERVPAIDGTARPAADWPCHDVRRARRVYGRALTGAEIGCFLSHVACLERFLRSDADTLVVFEDDAVLTAEGAQHLARALGWLARHPALEWDVINLARAAEKYATPLTSLGDVGLCAAHYFPLTTTGVAWSRRGAAAFLAAHAAAKGRIFLPIDDQLRWWCARSALGLAFRPALVTGSGEVSTIQPQDRARRGLAAALDHWRADTLRRVANYVGASRAQRALRRRLAKGAS